MQESILTTDQYKDLSKKIIYAVDTRYRIIPHQFPGWIADLKKRNNFPK